VDLVSIKTETDVIKALKEQTLFERKVLINAFRIPKGKVSTYKRIAEKIGHPKAYRAVGTALHNNPLAPLVPCHRVVASDGSFSGPQVNARQRRNLVIGEGVPIKNNKVKLSPEILF